MKKFALMLCLISTLLFTACGQEAAESSASIEETGFSQTQEVSETQKIPAIPKRLKQN